jgi:hypothetical protein
LRRIISLGRLPSSARHAPGFKKQKRRAAVIERCSRSMINIPAQCSIKIQLILPITESEIVFSSLSCSWSVLLLFFVFAARLLPHLGGKIEVAENTATCLGSWRCGANQAHLFSLVLAEVLLLSRDSLYLVSTPFLHQFPHTNSTLPFPLIWI